MESSATTVGADLSNTPLQSFPVNECALIDEMKIIQGKLMLCYLLTTKPEGQQCPKDYRRQW